VLVAIGYLTCTAIFWTIPATFLSGTASAGTIALISSIGQLGSLIAPTAIGSLITATHTISAGSYLAAFVLTCGAAVIAVAMRGHLAKPSSAN
jgi:ACS family phthalate transporter-like MFS transporter